LSFRLVKCNLARVRTTLEEAGYDVRGDRPRHRGARARALSAGLTERFGRGLARTRQGDRESAVACAVLTAVLCACGGSVKVPASAPPAVDPGPGSGALRAPATPVDAPSAPWSDEESPFPVSSSDPMWGERDAPVTILEYADFQCPFSARAEPTLEELKRLYGPKTVRILWRSAPLPSHPSARPASEAAMGVFATAGPDAFWKFHDLVFKNQSELALTNYELWAREAGVVEVAAWRQQLLAHAWAPKVDDDLREMKKAGLRSTPSFLINGTPFVGAKPLEELRAVVDTELAKATAKIASGTPRERVYVVMSTENARSGRP
jgi:protein-disulfide isomerase